MTEKWLSGIERKKVSGKKNKERNKDERTNERRNNISFEVLKHEIRRENEHKIMTGEGIWRFINFELTNPLKNSLSLSLSLYHSVSVTRRLDYFSIFVPFTTIKIDPVT